MTRKETRSNQHVPDPPALAVNAAAAERLRWAVDHCQANHIRLTAARRDLLRRLAGQHGPATLRRLIEERDPGARHDPATIYRALMLFVEAGLVRQINLPRRTNYFALNAPGEACDYLVCRICGRITGVPRSDAVARWEAEVSATAGFSVLYHELEIYGVCPACRAAGRTWVPATKLRISPPPDS